LFTREVTRYVSLECVGERGKLLGNLKNVTDMAACSTAEIFGSFREISTPIISHENGEESF
jgi:hypothetical protein